MAALCWRCFQIHFLLPVCQILTGFGTEHCISYWGTHCHYHAQHILKNRLWRKFRKMYSSVTSEGLAPWWPSCARSNLIYIESLCRHVHWTLQPRTFTNEYSVKLAMVSHIVLRIVCSSVAIPNVIWILKKKKNGRKSASDQANHEEPIDASPRLFSIQYGACINNNNKICLFVIFMQTNNCTISVYSSVPWQTVGTNNRLCQPNLSVLSFLILCFLNHVKHDKVNYWII